jgi:hypothetical protein
VVPVDRFFYIQTVVSVSYMYQNKNSNNRVGLADIVNKEINNYW